MSTQSSEIVDGVRGHSFGGGQSSGGGRKLRIVCVCEGLPHPNRGASKVLFHAYIQGMLDAGHSVRLVLLPQTKEEAFAEVPSALELGFSSNVNLEVMRVREFPCSKHTLAGVRVAPVAEAEIVAAIENFSPNVVLCFDVVAAALAQSSKAVKVVWLGDLQFETLWWHTHFAIKEGSRRYDRCALLPLRVFQLRRFYRRALLGTNVVVSSKSSEGKLAKLGIDSQYIPYPWPALVSRRSAETVRSLPTFLFSGTLEALGSRSAFHLLFSEIYPRLRAAFGGGAFAVWITGAGILPAWVADALASRPEIKFLGFVDDLGSTMDQCTAFLAPINVPVGNRSRLLTCMAAGLPIVAHPSTSLGNPLLVDGQTCLLEGEPAAFVSAAVRLYRDANLANMLAASARSSYFSHHSPEAASAKLIEHLSTAIHQL